MSFAHARLALLLGWLLAGAASVASESGLTARFAEAGVDGTLVIERLDGSERQVHDAVRAQRRFPAASTFKIFNSLIALDTGAVRGLDEQFTWDGTLHDFPDWNREQTLLSAYRVSCVWCYQAIARRIGRARYVEHLHAAQYGQLAASFPLTRFWLDGSLTLSAEEQIAFLRRIVRRQLPYSARAYAALRELMVMETRGDATIRAKTGWAMEASPPVGWYVGYVERPVGVWLFALNIDVRDAADLPLRRTLVLRALEDARVFD